MLNKRTAHSAYIKHTKKEVAILRDLVEHIKANYPLDHPLESACRYTKRIQDLLTNISRTCPSINNSGEKLVVVTPKNKDKRVRFTEPVTSSGNTKTTSSSNIVSNKPAFSSIGGRPSTSASRSQPSGNTKKDKIQRPSSSTLKNKVEAHPRKVTSSLKNKNSVVETKGTVNVQHSKLNANSKPLSLLAIPRKIRFSDHQRPTGRTFNIVGNVCPLTKITTPAEVPPRKPIALKTDTPKPVVTLVYSRKPKKSKTNVPVSKSKILKSISANKKEPSKSWGSIVSDVPSSSLDDCRPICVASVNGKKSILVIVDDYSRFTWVKCLRSKDEAPYFIIKFLKMIQKVGISHETSVARSPQQNGVVERRNRTLIEAARTMLIYAKASLFLWAEAVATTCYTQNRSIIHFDELKAMASEYSSSGPALHEMTLATISSGLVLNPPPSTPFVPLLRTDWDLLFQPLFDELLTPPLDVDHPALEVIALITEVVAPKPAASTGSPSSTTVDQDAPSPSNSQTTPKTQSPIIPNDVEEDNHDLDVAHMNNDPFFGIPIPENVFEASSSSNVIHTVVHTDTPNSKHFTK
ncbi:retrovirus-related pol polyprotein from transposon TNT 1-94 [Tanacetum coccineum]